MSSPIVPPTFIPILHDALPLGASAQCTLEHNFGTAWFWEAYQGGLLGHTVVARLGGTGVRLSEDSLDVLRRLRARAAKADLPLHEFYVSAALDVYFAFALSMLLHIAQQPLLEDNEGPHGLVLCATKEECDEMSYILNLLGAPLHLVVHNLFDLYPSMPASRRADVVVGTVPLWETVVQPSPRISGDGTCESASLDLDSILLCMNDRGRQAHSSTRWRPYSVRHISQCIIFDLELQVNMGFTPWLQRRLTPCTVAPGKTRAKLQTTPSVFALSPKCQLYVMLGEDRSCMASDELALLMSCISSRSRQCGMLNLSLSSLLASTKETGGHDGGLASDSALRVEPPRKRFAGDDEQLVAHSTCVTCGWVLYNALSFARLRDDSSALEELCQGVLAEVNSFWRSFEVDAASMPAVNDGREQNGHASPATAVGARGSVVTTHLAYICREVAKGECVQVQETCLLLRPLQVGETALDSRQMQRYALLFKHLEDSFSGRMFDGSIIYCSALDAATQPVAYRIIGDVSTVNHATTPHLLLSALYDPVQADKESGVGTRVTPGNGGSLDEDSQSNMSSAAVLLLCSIEMQEEKRSTLWTDLRSKRDLMAHAIAQSKRSQKSKLSLQLKSAERSKSEEEMALCACLPDVAPSDNFTVLVLRHVTATTSSLWCAASAPTMQSDSLANQPIPSIGLAIVEECCQYGRVVSYYTHEQTFTDTLAPKYNTEVNLPAGDESSVQLGSTSSEAGIQSSKDETNIISSTTASLFIEFERKDAAVEAARQLAYRFATTPPPFNNEERSAQMVTPRQPTVKLFRNDTYYDGVLEALHSLIDTTTSTSELNEYADFSIALLDE